MTVDGRTNEYKLSKTDCGETFKIGRVKFRVREISVCEDENKTDINSMDEELERGEDPINNSNNLNVEDSQEVRRP